MNKTYVAALAVLLLGAPLAFAHVPSGTLKNYCEDPAEFAVHDYAPPATGLFIALGQDGNLLGDCNGDTIPADYDGHVEWAIGGAWLLVDSGDGVTGGSLVCYGDAGHHVAPIFVRDVVLGDTVPFRVESDYINLVPPTDPTAPDCGDFTTDESVLCVDSCTPTFPPGLDGAYIVYVGDIGAPGTLGHVSTTAAAPATLV